MWNARVECQGGGFGWDTSPAMLPTARLADEERCSGPEQHAAASVPSLERKTVAKHEAAKVARYNGKFSASTAQVTSSVFVGSGHPGHGIRRTRDGGPRTQPHQPCHDITHPTCQATGLRPGCHRRKPTNNCRRHSRLSGALLERELRLRAPPHPRSGPGEGPEQPRPCHDDGSRPCQRRGTQSPSDEMPRAQRHPVRHPLIPADNPPRCLRHRSGSVPPLSRTPPPNLAVHEIRGENADPAGRRRLTSRVVWFRGGCSGRTREAGS